MSDDVRVYRTEEVFVPGQAPEVTYNPRPERNLDIELRRFLRQPGRALSIHGPTKSGKTVLVEAVIPREDGVWIQGDEIRTLDAFWAKIADQLDLFPDETVGRSRSITGVDRYGLNVGPRTLQGKGEAGQDRMDAVEAQVSRSRPIEDTVRDRLRNCRPPIPIVIDDFHYMPAHLRQPVARAIKSLIRVAPVVMVAVPANAFDAVRGESEMGGRVLSMQIDDWTLPELEVIASQGFKALNVADPGGAVGKKLAEESFGAPFLMQQLCLDLMDANDVEETSGAGLPHRVIPGDGTWDDFLRGSAAKSVPDEFKRLLRGPDPRGQDRRIMKLTTGEQVDVYGAIFAAAAAALPQMRMTRSDLAALARQQITDPPTDLKLGGKLKSLHEIAEEIRGSGDPMLVYNDPELHLLDPFLAFYLRWGPWREEGAARARG